MLFKKHHLLNFKYLIRFEVHYDPLYSNIIISNSTWSCYFKLKIYRNLYIVSDDYQFSVLNLVIK